MNVEVTLNSALKMELEHHEVGVRVRGRIMARPNPNPVQGAKASDDECYSQTHCHAPHVSVLHVQQSGQQE